MKALVVDDNKSNRTLEKDLLASAGYEVFEAESASEGIALAWEKRPDVIIMDVRLPDMRGSEVAAVLRRDAEMSDIPIVFVTASIEAEGKLELTKITRSGFIGKPINTRTFAKEIGRFITPAKTSGVSPLPLKDP